MDRVLWRGVPERRRFARWLRDLERDLAIPDLWGALEIEDQVFSAASDAGIENTPFTADERVELTKRLTAIADGIGRKRPLSDSQARLLAARMEQLLDASQRLGRKDWLAVFLGVMLTRSSRQRFRRTQFKG